MSVRQGLMSVRSPWGMWGCVDSRIRLRKQDRTGTHRCTCAGGGRDELQVPWEFRTEMFRRFQVAGFAKFLCPILMGIEVPT